MDRACMHRVNGSRTFGIIHAQSYWPAQESVALMMPDGGAFQLPSVATGNMSYIVIGCCRWLLDTCDAQFLLYNFLTAPGAQSNCQLVLPTYINTVPTHTCTSIGRVSYRLQLCDHVDYVR